MKNLHTVETHIDTWEIWVEVQEQAECPFNLYVVGEIYWSAHNIRPALVKRTTPCPPDELHLEVRPGVVFTGGSLIELCYSECLPDVNTYSDVFIYAGKSLIIHLKEIEVLVNR